MCPFSYLSDLIDTVLFGSELRCPVCGRLADRNGMCKACKGRIPYVLPPICSLCGVPLRIEGGANQDNPLCVGCLTSNHYFYRARAVAVYDGAARDHVHELKYRARTELAPALARMMAEVAICDGMAAECDCVVPVPLHPEKAARRGFNQAELLARDVGLFLGMPVEAGALHRKERGGSQTFLDKRNRRANVVRAFSCHVPSAVAGGNVLLVDDVLTSGATADGCGRALLMAGAAKVYVLTFGVSVADGRDWFGVRQGSRS
jgi:ComF family protein